MLLLARRVNWHAYSSLLLANVPCDSRSLNAERTSSAAEIASFAVVEWSLPSTFETVLIQTSSYRLNSAGWSS